MPVGLSEEDKDRLTGSCQVSHAGRLKCCVSGLMFPLSPLIVLLLCANTVGFILDPLQADGKLRRNLLSFAPCKLLWS